MSEYKKITAFLVGLMMCLSVYAPVKSAAVDETETTTATEEIHEEETEEENSIKTSGDFSYSITPDNTVCIENCTAETSELVIPETIDGMTVTDLTGKAFGGNPDRPYKKISIPSTVTYISEDNPFMYCIALEEIIVDSANENYISENGTIYTADKSLLICYPQAKGEEKFNIPEGVKEIGVAGVYNTKLSEVNLPSTLENIRRYGLGGNFRLQSIDMSKTKLEVIGLAGFIQDKELSDVILPDTLQEINDGAFMLCGNLEEITLPDSLTYVGQSAFMGTSLTKIEIPDSVEYIGYSAFGYEDDETPVDNFLIIGSYGSAAHIYSTDSDEEYDYKNNFAFSTPQAAAEQEEYNSFDKSMYGDFEYTAINGEAVITSCLSSDVKIEVPSEIDGMTVTRIYTSAFENSQAEEIIIPESVKTVDKLAFYNCMYLKSITMKGVETIGESAFILCESLSDVVISGNLKSFGDDEPFISCTLLESITITDGDGEYSSENGILYNKDKSKLLLYPPLKTDSEFTVPKSVKEIGMSSFCNNTYLEKINFSGVEIIGAYAFENSAKLKEANLTKSVTTVSNYAFSDCPSLESIRVYENTDTIGDYAFGYRFDGTTDESGNSLYTDNMALVDGFKIYAEENTTAYHYAKACNIEVISGTVRIFGKNMVVGFLWAVGAVFGLLVAGLAGFGIYKSKSKKKKNKSKAKRKENKNES